MLYPLTKALNSEQTTSPFSPVIAFGQGSGNLCTPADVLIKHNLKYCMIYSVTQRSISFL